MKFQIMAFVMKTAAVIGGLFVARMLGFLRPTDFAPPPSPPSGELPGGGVDYTAPITDPFSMGQRTTPRGEVPP